MSMAKRRFGLAAAILGSAMFQPPPAAAVAGQAAPGPLYEPRAGASRSLSAENPTGARGGGGLARDGTGKAAARELGGGWKVSPSIRIAAHQTATIADVPGPGVVRHIWLTAGVSPPATWRSLILRVYWDGERSPSIEASLGDFFAMGLGEPAVVNSQLMAVNPRGGFNSYWPMPFRRHARITVENLAAGEATLYYQIDYALEHIARSALYMHAQFRLDPTTVGTAPYRLLDGVRGSGQYVGTYVTLGVRHPGWWGEGELKFFLDGERTPTMVGTGAEAYFGGAWGFAKQRGEGYDTYTGLFTGMPQAIAPAGPGQPWRFGLYRWHAPDPIRFRRGLAITMQMLGWRTPEPKEGAVYAPLHERVSSLAYWYQVEPHAPFPPLPSVAELEGR